MFWLLLESVGTIAAPFHGNFTFSMPCTFVKEIWLTLFLTDRQLHNPVNKLYKRTDIANVMSISLPFLLYLG